MFGVLLKLDGLNLFAAVSCITRQISLSENYNRLFTDEGLLMFCEACSSVSSSSLRSYLLAKFYGR